MKTALIAAQAFAALTVLGTTYYVAPTTPPEGVVYDAADSEGYGASAAKPFATVEKAYKSMTKRAADGEVHDEVVLLKGTHAITTRIANGMLTYGRIRGETGDPADVTLDFGARPEACLLVADIQLSDVTVVNSACLNNGTHDGALRVQSTGNTFAVFPAKVENCVFSNAVTCPVALTGPAIIENCRFEDNSMTAASGRYSSLVYASNSSRAEGTCTIRGCQFKNNTSTGNGTCVVADAGESGEVLVDGCAFVGNATTGGMAADILVKASATVTGCAFTNSAAVRGGAIGLVKGTVADVTDSVFYGCRAVFSNEGGTGGAFYLEEATGSVSRCTFESNVSDRGAGVVRVGKSAKFSATDSVFRNNACGRQGGVAFADVSDSPASATYGSLEFVGCTFEGNEARCTDDGDTRSNIHGGGVVALGNNTTGESVFAPLFVDRCVFRNNTAHGSGGAIYMRNASNTPADCRVDIRNSLFVGNSAGCNGGAINYIAYQASVENCTFVDNTAGSSGPNIYHRWTSTLVNSILAGTQGDLGGTFSLQTANTSLYQNSIQAGRADGNMRSCFNGNACQNLDGIADVRFSDATGGDYSIRGSSPARDAGTVRAWMSDGGLDLAGSPRVWPLLADNGRVDIGAYEFISRTGTTLLFR